MILFDIKKFIFVFSHTGVDWKKRKYCAISTTLLEYRALKFLDNAERKFWRLAANGLSRCK